MGSTHLLAAVTGSSLIFGPDITAIIVSACGGLIPDIDHPDSLLGRKIPIIPELLNVLFGHRTFTHSLLGLAVTTIFLFSNDSLWGKAWAVGYGSHLLLDLLTTSGVPLFWPVGKNFRFSLTTTGGFLDMLSLILLIIANCATGWGRTHWLEVYQNISGFSFLTVS